jgi:DNA uptake protein ComE-like DNA-binding protein
MKVSSLENTSVQTPAVQLARLSGSHGYRFDGDTVHLNAMFALLDSDAHDRSWALQLWACPSAPASTQDLAGHIVAEVSLPPMGELADETEHFAVSAFSSPPASSGEYTMVLVLASGRTGEFQDIHDLAVYPLCEEFVQPRMSGTVGYSIDGARVQISVSRIENPRPEENLSGSLSLELWALSAPFSGRCFKGHHLAGVEIGSLSGQTELTLAPVDLAFNPPPAGDWHIALLLREWTANGFVTRDFTNFAANFVSAPIVKPTPAPVVEKALAPVIEKAITPVIEKAAAPVVVKSVALLVEKTVAPVVAKSAAPVAEKAVTPVAVKASAPVVTKAPEPVAAKTPAPVVVAKATPPVVVAAPARTPVKTIPPVAASARGVSVNTARVEELAAVKGLPQKLAAGIVKKRPFSSLDDLRRVKGLGPAILAKIRSSLKL